jgi:hypothetical protein
MIQIGEQPLPPGFTEGPPSDPDQTVGGRLGHERQLADGSPTETPLGVLFVLRAAPALSEGLPRTLTPFVCVSAGAPMS